MKRDAENRPTRSRSRKKAADKTTPAPEPLAVAAPEEPSEPARNIGELEGSLSVAGGVLLLVAALFPRTLKQLLLLGIGGGLVYRGMTGRCEVYSALGIDTAKEPLLKQINEKYLSAAGDA